MKLTIEDICNFPEFKNMRLIAGAEGLGKVVTSCGILDYEYDSSVKEKYIHTNFQNNQLILTSFLFAKNNEFLVMDAVKKLIIRGCSGLAVKNIFRLPFHDNLLRYADSMKFPIFLIEDPALYFEDMIITIKVRADQYTSLHYRAEKVNAMLTALQEHRDAKTQLALAWDINPSLRSDLVTLFFQSKKPLNAKAYFEIETLYYHSHLLDAGTFLLYYKNGFILVHSCEMFTSANVHQIAAPYLTVLSSRLPEFCIGVSRLHHSLPELAEAFQECLYANTIHTNEQAADYLAFDDMGVYQFLIPFSGTPYMRNFSETYIRPLQDYDAENKTALLSTAVQFVLGGGNIQRTAAVLNQHKNTIRYRLDRISKLYGKNVLQPEHYEKLSMAVKIHLCEEQLCHDNCGTGRTGERTHYTAVEEI